MSDTTTPTPSVAEGAAKRSVWHRLYHGKTEIDFINRWARWLLISGLVIAIGLISLFAKGLSLGIDFRGGTSWEVPAKNVSVSQVRDTLRPLGLAEAKIQTVRTSGRSSIRVQGEKTQGVERDKVSTALAKVANVRPNQVSVNFVGPSWGKDVSRKAQRALVVFFVLIAIYIALRFEWKMALAALAAVVHDILITVGIYSLSGFSVTPATVIAFLTILGYSLYDTIVVFDKVDENVKAYGAGGRYTYRDIVNLSMNQVLMRSLNTSLVAILPILSLLVFGAGVMGATALGDFGLALFIGLLTGAYSSIFIAAPILALLKEREPKFAAIKARLGDRHGGFTLSPAERATAAGTPGAARTPAGSATVSPGSAGGILVPGGGIRPAGNADRQPIAPRPRKQGKKR